MRVSASGLRKGAGMFSQRKERGDDFFENMANKLKELKRENSIVLVCPTKERAERIQHIFSEYELELPVSDEGTIRIELGELSSGFLLLILA